MRLQNASPVPRAGTSVRTALLRCTALCVAAACFVTAPTARADDAAAAQVLFDEATALKDKSDWAGACPKFESSYKLDPALGTLLNLANCFEKLGKIASAWARWEEAYQWATKNGDDRAEYAKTQRDALAPRLPKLKINVPTKAAALSIERDTTKVAEAMYGTALPVDPGEHTIFIKRDDEVLKTEKVKLVEAQTAEVSFDLAAIEKAAPPPKPKGNVVVVGASPALRKAGWAIGGVGVATVLGAAVLESLALSKKANATVYCTADKLCTPQGIAIINDARTFAEAGQWVGIGGLAVTAVGITLLIVAPSNNVTVQPGEPAKKDERAQRDVWAVPWVAPAAGGAGNVGASGGIVIGGHL
ncbi:MAG: hypothetical protein IPK82_41895 [Polyangiaceae bacterium]|nr:hypothetical protein [Polyangiaceae bacterium]